MRRLSPPSKRTTDQAWWERRKRSLLGSLIPLASLIQTLVVAEYLNFRHAANRLGVTTGIKTLE